MLSRWSAPTVGWGIMQGAAADEDQVIIRSWRPALTSALSTASTSLASPPPQHLSNQVLQHTELEGRVILWCKPKESQEQHSCVPLKKPGQIEEKMVSVVCSVWSYWYIYGLLWWRVPLVNHLPALICTLRSFLGTWLGYSWVLLGTQCGYRCNRWALCRPLLSNDDDMIIKWCPYRHNTSVGRCLVDSGCGWYDNQARGGCRVTSSSVRPSLAPPLPDSQLSSGSIWILAKVREILFRRRDPINCKVWSGSRVCSD